MRTFALRTGKNAPAACLVMSGRIVQCTSSIDPSSRELPHGEGCQCFYEEVKEKAVSKEQVNHPDHYGGKDNPYEVIKVMEAWLTPEEFIGAMKFNFFKYNARARMKGLLVDYQKAQFYQNYLVDFLQRGGMGGKQK